MDSNLNKKKPFLDAGLPKYSLNITFMVRILIIIKIIVNKPLIIEIGKTIALNNLFKIKSQFCDMLDGFVSRIRIKIVQAGFKRIRQL